MNGLDDIARFVAYLAALCGLAGGFLAWMARVQKNQVRGRREILVRRTCPSCGHSWERRVGPAGPESHDRIVGPCSLCGIVSGPGIWASPPDSQAVRRGKTGTLGRLLATKDRVREALPHGQEGEIVGIAAPDPLPSPTPRPSPRPPERPSEPLWDRWLDG